MIIHPLTPKCENGELVLAARIEPSKQSPPAPETLWFKIPEAQASLVSDRGEAFAVALLYFALRRGEDIHLRGTLSPRLAYGMQEYQSAKSVWQPGQFKPIEIRADQYSPAESAGKRNATAFSGGVESFYTLWTHLPQNEQYPGNALSYAMFVHGLDIGLHEIQTFRQCREAYRTLVSGWGMGFLTPATNVRHFDDGRSWMRGNQVALIALGHLYGRELARLYIGTGRTYSDFRRRPDNWFMDTLLSSESLTILEEGARVTRFERLEALSRFPPSYDHLRVCYVKRNGLLNCCECDKCVSTMTGLELCGALDRYTTFPRRLTRNRIRFTPMQFLFLREHKSLLRVARARKRYDIAFDIMVKLFMNSFRGGRRWVEKKVGGHDERRQMSGL
jgi:hypothetical protein